MIKAVSWFRRRPAMSVEEFQRYWREEHPKVVLQLPGLRKYVQNHVLGSQYEGAANPSPTELRKRGGTTGKR